MAQTDLKHEVEQLKCRLARANKLLKERSAGLNACMAKLSELEDVIAEYKRCAHRLTYTELGTLIRVVRKRKGQLIGIKSLADKGIVSFDAKGGMFVTDTGVSICSRYIAVAQEVDATHKR